MTNNIRERIICDKQAARYGSESGMMWIKREVQKGDKSTQSPVDLHSARRRFELVLDHRKWHLIYATSCSLKKRTVNFLPFV